MRASARAENWTFFLRYRFDLLTQFFIGVAGIAALTGFFIRKEKKPPLPTWLVPPTLLLVTALAALVIEARTIQIIIGAEKVAQNIERDLQVWDSSEVEKPSPPWGREPVLRAAGEARGFFGALHRVTSSPNLTHSRVLSTVYIIAIAVALFWLVLVGFWMRRQLAPPARAPGIGT